jgi:hypothetical protein
MNTRKKKTLKTRTEIGLNPKRLMREDHHPTTAEKRRRQPSEASIKDRMAEEEMAHTVIQTNG